MKNFATKSRKLADLADRHGMWCKDVARFPDLLKESRLKVEDMSPGLIGHAEGINREELAALIEKYGANQPPPILEEESPIRSRKSLFGIPVTHVIRWMGSNDWEPGDVRRVLVHMGFEPADGTIYTQLRLGSKGESVPSLEDRYEDQLWEILEETA